MKGVLSYVVCVTAFLCPPLALLMLYVLDSLQGGGRP